MKPHEADASAVDRLLDAMPDDSIVWLKARHNHFAVHAVGQDMRGLMPITVYVDDHDEIHPQIKPAILIAETSVINVDDAIAKVIDKCQTSR